MAQVALTHPVMIDSLASPAFDADTPMHCVC
jgi:hypothetical protein